MSRDQLYRQVGEALHLGQVLELQISVLVSILNNNFGSNIDNNGLILLENKKTLGRLINDLKLHASIEETGIEILKEALDKRNYIAHDFFNKNVYAFSDEGFLVQALERLQADTKAIAMGTALIQGFVQGFCEALNIDTKDILIEQSIYI